MGEPLFVINGFYMSMREKFTLPEAKLHYFVVDWSADALSWEDFRGKVLGATDPATAEDGAIRKMILDKWEELGLKSLPNVGDLVQQIRVNHQRVRVVRVIVFTRKTFFYVK